jgi:hypothetical protein
LVSGGDFDSAAARLVDSQKQLENAIAQFNAEARRVQKEFEEAIARNFSFEVQMNEAIVWCISLVIAHFILHFFPDTPLLFRRRRWL